MKKYLTLCFICGIIICLDQVTKVYIHANFALGEDITVIKDFFSLTYVRNFGAAFGFLNSAQETFRKIFFLVVPLLCMVFIFFVIKTTPDNDKLNIFAFSSVFGGALGNYIDRLRLGYVVDFLDFFIPANAMGSFPKTNIHWPAFNVADMAIVCGITVIIYAEWFGKKVEPNVKAKIKTKKA